MAPRDQEANGAGPRPALSMTRGQTPGSGLRVSGPRGGAGWTGLTWTTLDLVMSLTAPLRSSADGARGRGWAHPDCPAEVPLGARTCPHASHSGVDPVRPPPTRGQSGPHWDRRKASGLAPRPLGTEVPPACMKDEPDRHSRWAELASVLAQIKVVGTGMRRGSGLCTEGSDPACRAPHGRGGPGPGQPCGAAQPGQASWDRTRPPRCPSPTRRLRVPGP